MDIHKTVLVSCHIQNSPQAIPLATSLLKSYTEDLKNLNIHLLNLYLGDEIDEAFSKILKMNPQSVGFSMYIWNRVFIEELIRTIKKYNKDIIIYAGGAEVTASFMDLSLNKDIDFLLPGEGEIPFKTLMTSLIQKEIQIEGQILKKEHIKDLEAIPSPFLSNILDPELYDGILWELSRGCPFNCAFCSESRGIEGVRYFDEKRINKELQLFESKKVEQIWVLDPTFNINKSRAIRILSLINEYAPNIHYTFEIRAELLDSETAKAFSETHCSLQIGLQSCHNHVLEQLNRKLNIKDFEDKIHLLNHYGAVFGLDLICGLPLDTYDGFLQSLDFALMQIPNHLDVFRLSVFPGTELFEKAADFKIEFLNHTPYTLISTPDYNQEDLLKSEKVAQAVDIFYNKGRSAPWLLSVIELLDMKPSVFMEEFADFMNETPESTTEIFQLQLQYLNKLCHDTGKSNFMPIITDMTTFHYLYSEALHALNHPVENIPETYSLDSVYLINECLKSGEFFYDVTIYSEVGMINIEDFALNYFEEQSYGIIFNNGYEILTMGVDKSYYELIKETDGIRSLREVISVINGKIDEMNDFIDFLIEASLLIPAER